MFGKYRAITPDFFQCYYFFKAKTSLKIFKFVLIFLCVALFGNVKEKNIPMNPPARQTTPEKFLNIIIKNIINNSEH